VSNDDTVTIRRVDLQAIFDLAVQSMDFGSGFWDVDDVVAAGQVAVVLGLDPFETATPPDFKRRIPHAFRAYPWPRGEKCRFCNKVASDQIHQERAEEET
jgi:hypothetical protein